MMVVSLSIALKSSKIFSVLGKLFENTIPRFIIDNLDKREVKIDTLI